MFGCPRLCRSHTHDRTTRLRSQEKEAARELKVVLKKGLSKAHDEMVP